MTLPRIHIDVGDVQATDPDPVGVWDTARWDESDARWGGSMPNWTEVSCRVRAVEIDRGRSGALDIFEAGRATIDVANDDGWATWSTTAPSPVTAGSWIRVRADDEPLFTGTVRRIVDTYSPDARPGAMLVCVDPLARLAALELPARAPVGAGDTAAARITRVLDEAGWLYELADLDLGGPLLTATDMEGQLIDQAQRAAVTAGGHLFASRDGVVTYRAAGWFRTDPRATTAQALVTNNPTVWADNLLTQDQATASSLAGWTLNVGTPEIVGGNPDEGDTWMRIARADPGGMFLSPPNRVPVIAGETYTFMVSQRRQRPGTLRLVCRWFDAAGTLLTSAQDDITAATYSWVRHRQVVTAPAGAATVELRSTYPGMAAAEYGGLDRAGLFRGVVGTDDWTAPDTLEPAIQVCAIGMSVNGQDIERVLNTVNLVGVDDQAKADAEADPDLDWQPTEVTRIDGPSRRRYGPATWQVSDLFTTDVDQLTILGERVLALRAEPAPWIESLDLSPLADAAAAGLCKGVEFGDRLTVTYLDRLGWTWTFEVHVHRIVHSIRPSGDDNQAAEWTLTLTLDDATALEKGAAWDFAIWDTDAWDQTETTTREQEAMAWA